jgi:predicted PurR-regulated permease PerM
VATTKPVIPTKDDESPDTLVDIWAPAAQIATVGIFIMLLGICLYVCRPLLLPVVAAVVIGITLAPVVKLAAHRGVPPWLTAGAIGVTALVAAAIGVTFLANPVTSWIARAPEIGAILREKLYWLDRPLAAIREVREAFCLQAAQQLRSNPRNWELSHRFLLSSRLPWSSWCCFS